MTEFIPLIQTYADKFKADSQGFIKIMGVLDVPKQIISSMYEYFVFKKEIEPIETLPTEDKKRIWEIAKASTKTADSRIMVSHTIYLMEFITQTRI